MTHRRLCFVTTFYPPAAFGGDAIGLQRIARALAKYGYDVTVVHDADAYTVLAGSANGGRRPADDRQPFTADERDPVGVRVVTLRSRWPMLSTLLTQQTGRPVLQRHQLREILDGGRFDAIIYNNVSLVGGPGILSYGRGAAKVYLAHEHWLVCPTHVLWRHNRERCDGRECVRCQLHHHRPPQLWRHSNLLARQLDHVDTFVAMSEFSRAKHHEFGFPREMEVLPCFPADPLSAGDDPLRAPHPRPYFLFVGRLERIKGLDDVISAWTRYTEADLLVIGDGSHGDTLRHLAGDNPRVRFLGRVPNERLGSYYRHAVALLAPSVGFETFGLTLIEAFSHGTPVIARRLGPFPEIVDRSGGGLLFGTTAEMLDAMRALQNDRPRREALGRAGHEGYRRFWSEGAVLPAFIRLLQDAWARRNGVPH